MSKKKIAKISLDFKDFMFTGMKLVPEIAIAMTTVVSAISAMSIAAGTDLLKPLEDDNHPKQELAIGQYNDALSKLSKQKAISNNALDQDLTPIFLKEVIKKDAGSDKNNLELKEKKQEIEKEKYQNMIDNFVSATLVDQRLNEVQTKKLLTKFISEHGEISKISNFNEPDYNDIQECRLDPSINNNPQQIYECTERYNNGSDLIITSALTAFFMPWVIAGGIATQNKRLNRWKNGPGNH